jgi:ribose transport system ATP-binding protein/inositol transport system ATP-binding protein
MNKRGEIMKKELLRMENIVKTFPGVRALSNAAITVHAGEVMGFMGENGAGKSTLMNVLGGVFPADSGEIYIEGQKADIRSIHDSQSLGVAFIHQELALEPYLTIAENIFLGREMKNSLGMISKDKMAEAARPFLERVGLEVDPNEFVGRLSLGQQQMVEIAKSFSLHAKILILDEPTSSLSEKEVNILFRTVEDLKKQGMGIIFITHKMAEVFQLCDAVTIMRDGEYMDTLSSENCTESQLISLMVGRDLGNYYVRTFNQPGDVILEAKHIHAGKRAVDCSFSVRSGEILGFYGLVGSGRSELMKAIMGLDPMDSGEILLNGENVKKANPMYMQERGVALVPESRKTEGLLLKNTIGFNITLPILSRFISHLRVDSDKEQQIIDEGMESLRIKAPSDRVNCSTLSGGNQQKVLLAKWLATNPRVLILDEPTRGIDVGAKAEIYTIINDLAKRGLAVILISSEMPEVMNMSDRMMIMNEGRITGELDHTEYSQELILKYAMGVANHE